MKTRSELLAVSEALGARPEMIEKVGRLFAVLQRFEADESVAPASGRRVADLGFAERAAGVHEVAWNGRDERGSRVRAGVHLAVLDEDLPARVERNSLATCSRQTPGR